MADEAYAAPRASTAPRTTSASPAPSALNEPAPGAAVPTAGTGQLQVARVTRAAPLEQTGRTVRVRVEVEREMPTDPENAAAQIADVLQDERSWSSKQRVRFALVGEGGHDLVIRVLTPRTTDNRCLPLRTLGEVSCSTGNAVNLNGVRWETGIPDYPCARKSDTNKSLDSPIPRGAGPAWFPVAEEAHMARGAPPSDRLTQQRRHHPPVVGHTDTEALAAR